MLLIFLGSTGGSLVKRVKVCWPGTPSTTSLPRQVVAADEFLGRLGEQLVGIGLGLREDLGILDYVEGEDLGGAVLQPQFHPAKGKLPDIDTPDDLRSWHIYASFQRLGRASRICGADSLSQSGLGRYGETRQIWLQPTVTNLGSTVRPGPPTGLPRSCTAGILAGRSVWRQPLRTIVRSRRVEETTRLGKSRRFVFYARVATPGSNSY